MSLCPSVPSQALAPLVFWFLLWIFSPGNPTLCPQFSLEEKENRSWNGIYKEKENLFFCLCIQELWYPLYPSNSLGGKAMLWENQSKSDSSFMTVEKAFERWQNCRLYVFELDSMKALLGGIPCAGGLGSNGEEGRDQETHTAKCTNSFFVKEWCLFPRLSYWNGARIGLLLRISCHRSLKVPV